MNLNQKNENPFETIKQAISEKVVSILNFLDSIIGKDYQKVTESNAIQYFIYAILLQIGLSVVAWVIPSKVIKLLLIIPGIIITLYITYYGLIVIKFKTISISNI